MIVFVIRLKVAVLMDGIAHARRFLNLGGRLDHELES